MPQEDELKNIPIENLTEPEEEIRTVIVMEKLEALAESIKEQGLIQPLVVFKKGEKYEISAGHRRYLASKMAGLVQVPCIIKIMDERDQDLVKIHENFHREDPNPLDEAKFFLRLQQKYNVSLSEVARLCSRSYSYVVSRTTLVSSDPRVLAAWEGGNINFSQALELGKIKDGNILEEVLRVVIESGATVSSIRIMRQDYERAQRAQTGAPEPYVHPEGNIPVKKYLYKCPGCQHGYEVTEIFPISVCKGCGSAILEGLAANQKQEKE